jgi:hypothetical protein
VRSFLALALFAAAIGTGVAADPDAPSVRAYAVNINHPPKEASREIVSNEYTGVYLFANLPGKQIVALDTNASKLTVTDDKGTEIFASSVKLTPTSVTTDKSKAQGRMYLLSQKAPAEGATRIRVKGEVVFLCGVGEKTSTAENFALKAKEKAEVGPALFEVSLPKDRAVVSLKTDSPIVKSISFTGADGKALGATGMLNLGVNGDGKVVHFANYTLPAKLESVGIKVVHYEKIEAVKVVVDSETGVGP